MTDTARDHIRVLEAQRDSWWQKHEDAEADITRLTDKSSHAHQMWLTTRTRIEAAHAELKGDRHKRIVDAVRRLAVKRPSLFRLRGSPQHPDDLYFTLESGALHIELGVDSVTASLKNGPQYKMEGDFAEAQLELRRWHVRTPTADDIADALEALL